MSESLISIGVISATTKRFVKPFLDESRKARAEKIIHAFVKAFSELSENETRIVSSKKCPDILKPILEE